MNSILYGISLPTSVHSGSHPSYNNNFLNWADDVEFSTLDEAFDILKSKLVDVKNQLENGNGLNDVLF